MKKPKHLIFQPMTSSSLTSLTNVIAPRRLSPFHCHRLWTFLYQCAFVIAATRVTNDSIAKWIQFVTYLITSTLSS